MLVNLTNFRNKSSLTLFSGRVKAVSMSKDGKKFSFSSNFDSPEGVSQFATSEVALLRADDKPCIYEYSKKNSSDQIVVTGCENEIREMQHNI